MTESEWLNCNELERMLEFVCGAGHRKHSLLACCCCRSMWHLLPDVRSRTAIGMVERSLDGLVSNSEFHRTKQDAVNAAGVEGSPSWIAWTITRPDELRASWHAAEVPASNSEWKTRLFRDIFGNPFRPISINPAWLTPTVLSLAQAAYDERIMPSGELAPDRLAVLSDALEEAGCDDADILNHLRSPGPHVRSCWAVDLLLGKE